MPGMGRPKKFTKDQDTQLRALLRMKPTRKDCAAFFEVSEDTIERYIKRTYKITYAEFGDQNMVHTRFDLVRTAIRQAKSGNTAMLIFCLKNMCGWADKQEISTPSEGIKINYEEVKKS